MDLIDLEVIGWLFSVVSGIALALGFLIIVLNHSRDETRAVARNRVLEDIVLSLIWALGLAGGAGVLLGQGWSRLALEFFCWTLMVLLLMSCWSWLRATPPPRHLRAVQLALFVISVIAICMATILTLRGETALRVLSG